MKKVQMYQSIDGKLHETEEQCREHEQKLNLRQWYEGGNELELTPEQAGCGVMPDGYGGGYECNCGKCV